MKRRRRGLLWLAWPGCAALASVWLLTIRAWAQLDPERRELVQIGYNQPLEGRGPIAGYAYYYDNQPDFRGTNISLRVAIAPVYLDSELGFKRLLGPSTDLAVGLSGGGFADSYYEIDHGQYRRDQSFLGHGAGVSVSVYHLFNPLPPGSSPTSLGEVPLQALVRIGPHYTFYERDDYTAANFVMPDDRWTLASRVGIRWGGREPVMEPDQAVELSVWHEGFYRSDTQSYGYNGDRAISRDAHQFWARALAAFGFTNTPHHFEASFTLGASLHADRFSAFRLGGDLPLMGEFPLTLPGYYLQEFSARQFALLAGEYTFALTANRQWTLHVDGAVADVGYLPGLRGPGQWVSGVGGGLAYHSPSGFWHVVAGYDRGLNAQRDAGRGSNTILLLLQIDLERSERDVWRNIGPNALKGLQGLF